MTWRFWRARERSVDYGPDPAPPTVDEAADEGIAMAEQAALMAVKNRILVDAHRGDEGFDPTVYLDAAREILLGLAAESHEAAERTRLDRRNASLLKGRSIHQHDYRRDDVDNLLLRERSFETVAERLIEIAADDIRLLVFVERARERAWEELARQMEHVLDRAEVREFGDENYAAEREARMRDFIAVDLFRLQMQAQRNTQVAADTAEDYE